MTPSNTPIEILIVEDSPTQVQRLEHILTQQGYHVVSAADGRKALEAVQRRKPTLIISDVVMPEMDGYELCRRIKADASLSDIPIILVTTLSDPQDVIRGLECRADNFILKPYDEHHLLSRVDFVLVNFEVRKAEPAGMGVDIFFNGHKHFITADRLQILNLLLSTYEAAMQRNTELRLSQGELQRANSELQQWTTELEARVRQRAQELERVNQALADENAGRQRLEAQMVEAQKMEAEARAGQAELRMAQAEAQSEAIRTSELSYRRLFEAARDGILVLDADTGRISDVNPFLVELLGFSHSEMVGKTVGELSPFKDMVSNKARLEQLQQHGYVRYENLPLETKDGRTIAVEFVSNVYQAGDKKVIQCNIRDMTERERFQRALQETNLKLESAKSAAEKANHAKSDFLSSMSHELRSPLNAILGFAQLMESASPSPTASQTKSIAQILQAGWYLLKLINEILDLAGIESGKVPFSQEAVSLSELMSECHSMMEPQAQERGLRMSFPQFDHPIFVSADRTRLKQIIINLVSNAIKYNREQGTVVVDWTATGPERIRISVRDTGAGMPPEKLAQLFTPFNRLGQEAGSVAGTGIGLVVSKRLAELMDGVLGVESTVGVGSVFWCELNSAAAPQLKDPIDDVGALIKPEAPADAPRRTLLYVEDNPANMELVEQLIARFPDLRLVTAVNGTLGVELARSTQPQVILMDINLPGISGIKALEILREDPATAHIPVIALSANAMPRDISKGLTAGFFRYLAKPINIKELMDTLNEALNLAGKTVERST